MNAHLWLLVGYSAVLVGAGLAVARLVRGSSDFFVAGRRLGVPLIFATVLAANIGAGATVGATGLAYRDGLSAWWWSGSAAIGSLLLALFVGPRIWRIAKDHNLYTAGDYLEHRYSPTVRAVVTSLIWLGTLSILAGQLIAGAAVLTVVADVPRTTGILLSAAVMTVYFVAGGLLGSAWINALQLVVLLGGFAFALPMVLATAGGYQAVAANPAVPDSFGSFFHSSGPGSGWLLIALVPAFIISPGLMQKAYGASSARAVRWGIGLQALALAGFAFIPALFGMAARATNPGITDPNLVLPTVLADQLPVALGALGLAAVYSAEVSTCDALLFMLATSLSKDLFKRFLRPQASDAQVLAVARWAAVAGALGGVLFALWLPTVTDALRIFYALLGVSLLVPVVGGLYSRVGANGAMASILAGMAGLLVTRFVLAPRFPWLDPTLAGLLLATLAYVLAPRGRGIARAA